MRALAKFPEENPNPVLRATAAGDVLFANAAARAVDGLLTDDNRQLARALREAVAGAFAASAPGQATCTLGGRRYAFSLTPIPAEGCVTLAGQEVVAASRALPDAGSPASFAAENPNPVLRVAGDGSVLYANPAALALDGLTQEAGRCLVPQLAARVTEAFASRRITQAEFSNGLRLYAFAVTPVPQADYVNLYGRDVTEERRAQREARSLAKFPEENPNPVLRVDGLGGVLYANAAAKQAAGLMVEEGRRLCVELAKSAESAYATKRPVDTEFSLGARLLAFTFMPVAQEGYINVTARDVGDERRASHEAIRGKRFNDTIIASLSNGVMAIDPALRITAANPAALRLLDLDAASVIGRTLAEALKHDAWLPDAVAAERDAKVRRAWPERTLTSAKGVQRLANLTLVPLADETGARGHLLVIEDISREARVRATMARFMPDAVVERLLAADDAQLDCATQDATILYAGIRNFVSLSDRLEARATVDLLNAHFAGMVEAIFAHGGTLDKFIGDALLAAFGAPFASAEDPDHALQAAIAMFGSVREFNRRLEKAGVAPLDFGISIDTGAVIAGMIGVSRRADYTVIGEPVTRAARLEAINKHYGTGLLISEATRRKLTGGGRLREIDLVRVPGAAEPVRLFEVLDHHTAESFPHLERVLTAFEEGLKLYRGRDFGRAAQAFGEALSLHPADRPTQIFLSRCWSLQARPPGPAWQGVADLAG